MSKVAGTLAIKWRHQPCSAQARPTRPFSPFLRQKLSLDCWPSDQLLVSIPVVLAFALPATAEEKPGKSGPMLNFDLGNKKDGVGVKAKVDPKKKDPLSSLEVQIGAGDKKSKSEKTK